MPYKEKNIEKSFYSIGEVAKIFKVNTSLIRFWEKEFDILKPFKNKKGNGGGVIFFCLGLFRFRCRVC